MGQTTQGDVQVSVGDPGQNDTAWHAYPSAKEVLKELGSSEDGLSAAEAEARLSQYGRNALTPPKKPGFFLKLW